MISVLLSLFTVMLGVGIISPLLPLIAKNYDAAGVWIGLIFSAFSISRVVSLPFFGGLADRVGGRRIFLTGLFLYTLIAILYAFARSKEELLIVRVIHGSSSAMVIPVAMAFVAAKSPKDELGKSLGRANSSLFLGMAFGPLIGGFFAEKFGYEFAFFLMSLFSAVSFAIAYFTFPEYKKKEKVKTKGKLSRNVAVAVVYRLVNSLGRGSVMSFLPIYLALLGYGTTEIGLVLFTNLIFSALIQIKSGSLADRFGYVKPVWVSGILASLSLLAIVRFENLVEIFLFAAVLGVTTAVSLPAVSSLVAVEGVSRSLESSYMGIFSASKSLGRAIGPILAGLIYDLSGGGLTGVRTVFEVAALLSLFAAFIYKEGVNSDEVV